MKKWFVILLVAVLVLAVVIGIGSCYWPVWAADCIVRISYTGFAGLFHERYAYYAICGDNAVRVAPWVLEQLAPEAISGNKYKDTMVTHQWFAHLYYMPRVEMFNGDKFLSRNDPWMPTEFGEKYRVYYQGWSGTKIDAGTEVQAVMVDAAHYFHDGDINNMSSYSYSGERGLTWYILVSNGEKLLLQHKEETLYRPLEDGTFQLLMECPPDGQFDYFWFP